MIHDWDLKIRLATDQPLDILEFIDNHPVSNGLFLLDVDLGTDYLNGIELGAKIRQRCPNAKIVFITIHSESVHTTFEYVVEAMGYIIKSSRESTVEEIRRILKVAYDRYLVDRSQSSQSMFKVELGGTIRLYPFEEIMFFEKSLNAHQVILVHEKGEIKYRGNLKDIEQVSEYFFRSHQSFIINLMNIVQVDRKKRVVTMKDGSQYLVSTRKLTSLIALLDAN